MENFTEIGIGGMLVAFVIKEMFSFLRNRNGNGTASKLERLTDVLLEQTLTLKEIMFEQKKSHDAIRRNQEIIARLIDKLAN